MRTASLCTAVAALSLVAAGVRAGPQSSAYYGNGYYGNGYYGNGAGNVVRCESSDGRARRCAMETYEGVRLVRQVSDSACIEGRSWGYDRSGVWVSNGCRAEFVAGSAYGYGSGGGAGYYGGGYYDPHAGGAYGNYGYPGSVASGYDVFRCESTDGRWRNCGVDTRGGVQIVRQISDSACIRGQTWGWDGRGVWVDRGCRAEFRAGGAYGGGYGSAYGNGGGYSNGYGQVLRCESVDGGYRQCPASIRGGARIVRQLSDSACIQGQSWGTNRAGLWVDRGCRAEFVVGARGNTGWGNGYDRNGYGYGYGNGAARTVRCESSDGRTRRCSLPLQGARLQRQLSSSRCLQGQSWGWDRAGLWVTGGCRGEFTVW